MRRSVFGITAATTAAFMLFTCGSAVACDKVASPTGSDSAAGSVQAPYRTVQKTIDSLSPGQTGCLRGGLYDTQTSLTIQTPAITLTDYQGEAATVKGKLWITNQGNDVTVSGLKLDGRPGVVSPNINADRVTIRDNEITNNNTEICLHLGNPEYGRAEDTVIEGNNIHHCGQLPSNNQEHGIYLNSADRTIIRDNRIHHNADFAIHLYPDADNSLITGNVMDSNGEGIIFSGEHTPSGYETSDNNVVRNNVITNSQIRQNVESYYPDGAAAGTGNVVTDNCLKGAPGWYAEDGSGVQSPQKGFTATDTLIHQPAYANPSAGDYAIPESDPCAAVLAGGQVSGGVTPGTGSGSSTEPQPAAAEESTPAPQAKKKKRKRKRTVRKARR
jgi:nitrous oxidase accessory protein NosD